MTATEQWLKTGDGFCLCPRPLNVLLKEKGIDHTGLSSRNPKDVDSYFDDWYLYQIVRERTVYSLVKLREQEYDYIPGFSDRDEPSVTVSFIAFPIEALEELPQGCPAGSPAMEAFLDGFQNVTQRFPQAHDPILQRYFSDPASKGSYLIASCYVEKLLRLFPDGRVPLPARHSLASLRLRRGIRKICGSRPIVDFTAKIIRVADPQHPALAEQQVLLAFHTGNLSYNSFAAEVKFHADALVGWQARIPLVGHRVWYHAAIRADMGFGPESNLYTLALCPYYRPKSKFCREQAALHGAQ